MAHKPPETELILSNIEAEGLKTPKEDKNLDFVDDWLNVSVENEVCRGKQLRLEKPIPNEPELDYDFINIDFLGSVSSKKRHERNRHLKPFKGKTSPSTPRSSSPYPRPTSAASAYSPMNRISRTDTPKVKRKKPKKCSMRIAELAVPTKRQCIDTWRNKSYLLPEFMVDRLKQHVMDQKPIVKIPEALYCFQRPRPQTSKKYPQNKNENNHQHGKSCLKPETRMLCIVFAHKVSKILERPMNLMLNSKLAKIFNVVASDTAKLMSKSECPCSKVNGKIRWNQQYSAIHVDVSKKITVWIAGILEDLSLKLLEEDLRVKKEKERHADFAKQLITIMENAIRHEKKIEPTDLEEEEGPVLDFIDDVVDKVINICEPPPVFEEDSDTTDSSKGFVSGEESDKSLSSTESTEKKKSKLDEIFDTDKALSLQTDEHLTDADHFRKVINNIIDNIDKDDIFEAEISKKYEVDLNEEFGEDISQELRDDIGKKPGDDVSKEPGDDITNESEEDINNGLGDEIENDNNTVTLLETQADRNENNVSNNEENIEFNGEIEDVNDDRNELNVSEGFHIIAEDIKDSKKVIFSKTDLVNPDDVEENIEPRPTEQHKTDEHGLSQTKNHSDKSSIVFAGPNNQLLSDADESWPSDLPDKPPLKLSDTVSKSIMSLGKLIEKDEKQISPPGEASNVETSEQHKDYFNDILMESSEVETSDSQQHKNDLIDILMENDDKKLTHPKDKSNKDEMGDSKQHTNDLIGKLMENDDKKFTLPKDKSNKDETGYSKEHTNYFIDKLIENDDKQIMPREGIIRKDQMSDTKQHKNEVITANIHFNEKSAIGRQPSKTVTKETTTAEKKNTVIQVDLKAFDNTSAHKTITIPNKYAEKLIDKSNSHVDKSRPEGFEKHQSIKDNIQTKIRKLETSTGRTEDGKIPSHKTQSQIDYSWRVHPKTAPSWVISCIHDRGEPSEDSIPIPLKPVKVKESDMRKWCKDLEKAYTNLEMWSNWINTTCKETVLLTRQIDSAFPGYRKKNTASWIRLNRNVHKDAILWTKLYQHTEDVFKNLKRKYNNIEYSSNLLGITTKSGVNKAIFNVMCEFENDCLLLHKMIVTAEYCAMRSSIQKYSGNCGMCKK